MKPSKHPKKNHQSGTTLLEMTIVIMVLLTLVGVGTFGAGRISDWKLAREAGETLRTVHAAQRMFLADRPTTLVQDITADDLIPYLPKHMSAIPTVESLEGDQLTIRVNTNPPVVDGGSGVVYDPSGSPRDSLWDIGQ